MHDHPLPQPQNSNRDEWLQKCKIYITTLRVFGSLWTI
jgi:hypothetical protein